MSDDEKKSGDSEFLSRWSRRKQEAREQPPPAPAAIDPAAPVPELPAIDGLTMDSDFRGFFHPGVDENLRRAALKKLFSDPHFNIMDGLDTYIDDYSQPNPLPAAMLAGLRQAQNILAWAKETKEETAARFAPPPVADAATLVTDEQTPPVDSTVLPAKEQAADAIPAVPETAAQEVPARSEPSAAERKS